MASASQCTRHPVRSGGPAEGAEAPDHGDCALLEGHFTWERRRLVAALDAAGTVTGLT